ncbi:SAM-dependent methyltransferase [Sulfitobacter sp. SK012]|uniref:class I SAM-dependent methyltransferase n=1 Tax=Sulfitobacter sp. SK012 TaxID=1389005 RepID=UPI000E0A9E0D|nr:class I SAM-dependent methyltransferase [Sulfitobacter sp. SK012]AXI45393.1 SAM-dependent methyltransferase [Sulfitobacter sp. SK012]
MSDKDKVFSGSIPDIYDDYLVPLIFESYAKDMAQRVARVGPNAVLETAAGSGVVTRALAPLLKDEARYVVTDLNPPMLDRAAKQQPDDTQIEWQQADAMSLPFDDETFDIMCCQFGMMFLPDKAAGYTEAFRMLREGGQFIFNVWDKIENNEFAQNVTATATRFFPDDPPIFLERTPHGYHDIASIKSELQSAGFSGVEVHTITEQSHAENARIPAIAYCQGTPLRNELLDRDASCLDKITNAAAVDIEQVFGSGAVTGKIQGFVIVASK